MSFGYVLNMFRDAFSHVFDWMHTIEFAEGFTMWDLIIAFFIAMIVIKLVMREFGASGIASSVNSTIDSYQHTIQQKNEHKE